MTFLKGGKRVFRRPRPPCPVAASAARYGASWAARSMRVSRKRLRPSENAASTKLKPFSDGLFSLADGLLNTLRYYIYSSNTLRPALRSASRFFISLRKLRRASASHFLLPKYPSDCFFLACLPGFLFCAALSRTLVLRGGDCTNALVCYALSFKYRERSAPLPTTPDSRKNAPSVWLMPCRIHKLLPLPQLPAQPAKPKQAKPVRFCIFYP